MAKLQIVDKNGHTELDYQPANYAMVDQARQEFMKKLEEGYLAYTVGDDGKADTAIREFDPQAQRIVMTPPLVGG